MEIQKKKQKQKYPLVLGMPLIEINEKITKMDLPDICFLLGEKGIYRYNKNRLYTSIIKVDKFGTCNNINTGMKWHLSKIPYTILQETIAFFKDVYDEYKSEACVILYYNFKKKIFKIGIPEQEVTPSTIDYKNVPKFEGFDIIGSIHCHASMSAFHSGTDDDDELTFDGLHITVGTIENPTFACRFITNGEQKKIDIKEVFDMPSLFGKSNKEHMTKVKKKEFKITTAYSGALDSTKEYWMGWDKTHCNYNKIQKTLNEVNEEETKFLTYCDLKTGNWKTEDIKLLSKKERKKINKWLTLMEKNDIDVSGIINEGVVENL